MSKSGDYYAVHGITQGTGSGESNAGWLAADAADGRTKVARAEAESALRDNAYLANELDSERSRSRLGFADVWGTIDKIFDLLIDFEHRIIQGESKDKNLEVKIDSLNGKAKVFYKMLSSVTDKVETALRVQNETLSMIVSLRQAVLTMADQVQTLAEHEGVKLETVSMDYVPSDKMEDLSDEEAIRRILPYLEPETKAVLEGIDEIYYGFLTFKNCIPHFFDVKSSERPFRITDIDSFNENWKETRDMLLEMATPELFSLHENEISDFLRYDPEGQALVKESLLWNIEYVDMGITNIYALKAAKILAARQQEDACIPVAASTM